MSNRIKDLKISVDVDIVIDKYNERAKAYNEAHPKLRQTELLDRAKVATMVGTTPQLFADYKNQDPPKAVKILYALAEIGQCDITEFVNEIKD